MLIFFLVKLLPGDQTQSSSSTSGVHATETRLSVHARARTHAHANSLVLWKYHDSSWQIRHPFT